MDILMKFKNVSSFFQQNILNNALLAKTMAMVIVVGTLTAAVVIGRSNHQAADDFECQVRTINQELNKALTDECALKDKLSLLCKSIQTLKTALIHNPSRKLLFYQGSFSWESDVYQPTLLLFDSCLKLHCPKICDALIAKVLRQADALCDELSDQECKFFNSAVSNCTEKWCNAMHLLVNLQNSRKNSSLAALNKPLIISSKNASESMEKVQARSAKPSRQYYNDYSSERSQASHTTNYYPKSGSNTTKHKRLMHSDTNDKKISDQNEKRNIPATKKNSRPSDDFDIDLFGSSDRQGVSQSDDGSDNEDSNVSSISEKKRLIKEKLDEETVRFQAEEQDLDKKMQLALERENEDTMKLWLELMNK